MDLIPYLRAVKRSLILIIPIVVLAATGAYLVTQRLPVTYEARARMIVTGGLGGSQTTDLVEATLIARTYASLATALPLMEQVGQRAGIDDGPESIRSRLSVVADLDVPFLSVTAEDGDPDRAALLANTLADVLVLRSATATGSDPLLSIVDPAVVPGSPTSPRTLLNTILAAIAALVLCLVVVAVVAIVRSAGRAYDANANANDRTARDQGAGDAAMPHPATPPATKR